MNKRRRDLDADTDRWHRDSVGDDDEHAATFLICERAGGRRETHRIEMHAGNAAVIENVGERDLIDPRCANLFERRIGAATD